MMIPSGAAVVAAISALLLAPDVALGSSHRAMKRRGWRHYNQTCFDERERELRSDFKSHPVWFVTDTSNFRLVFLLLIPYMVHATSLI